MTQPTPEFLRHLQYLADIMAINLDCPAIASIPDEVYRDMAKKQTQPRQPRVKKPPPRVCGACPWLAVRQRTDFYPYSPEFWCGLTGRWVGFRPVTPEWCLPVVNNNHEDTKDTTG